MIHSFVNNAFLCCIAKWWTVPIFTWFFVITIWRRFIFDLVNKPFWRLIILKISHQIVPFATKFTSKWYNLNYHEYRSLNKYYLLINESLCRGLQHSVWIIMLFVISYHCVDSGSAHCALRARAHRTVAPRGTARGQQPPPKHIRKLSLHEPSH
jgi:hypothetical protein